MAQGEHQHDGSVSDFIGFRDRRIVRRLKSILDAACIDEVVEVPHTEWELVDLRNRVENDNAEYLDFVLTEARAGRVKLKVA